MVFESTFKIPEQVVPLDDVLLELGISRVDFIKLDVEGAELSALPTRLNPNGMTVDIRELPS